MAVCFNATLQTTPSSFCAEMKKLNEEVNITFDSFQTVNIQTQNYDQLENKPQINGVSLEGDKSALELSLLPSTQSSYQEIDINSARQDYLICLSPQDDVVKKISVANFEKGMQSFVTNDELDTSIEVGKYQFVKKN